MIKMIDLEGLFIKEIMIYYLGDSYKPTPFLWFAISIHQWRRHLDGPLYKNRSNNEIIIIITLLLLLLV